VKVGVSERCTVGVTPDVKVGDGRTGTGVAVAVSVAIRVIGPGTKLVGLAVTTGAPKLQAVSRKAAITKKRRFGYLNNILD
jgi:hypothetical protein